MADSTINIESDDELIKALNAHSEAMNNYKERIQGDTEFTNRYKAAPPNSDTKPDFGGSFSESTTQRNLDNQAKRANIKYVPEFLKYSKDFHQFSSAIASGATSPGGLMRRLNMGGGIAGSAANTAVTAGVAFAANAQDYRNRAAQAAAYGLTPYQQAAFGNQFKDLIGEGGASGIFGELIRQQTAGPGQPSLFKGWMGQYGQKTTGEESQEDLAEKFLKAQETFAKTVDPQLWKTLSENMGVSLDMGNLMRLREAKPGELDKDIAEERRAGKGYLDDKGAQALKDLGKESETTTQRMVKNWDWITSEVAPWLTDFLKHLGELSGKQGGVSKNIGEGTIKDFVIPFVKLNEEVDKWWGDLKSIITPGAARADEQKLDWNAKDVPNIPIPDSLTGKGANLPSEYATPKEFEIGAGGQFVLPGSEKVPENIQDIRDAIVNSKILVDPYLSGGLGSSTGFSQGGGELGGVIGGGGGGMGGGGSGPHSPKGSGGGGVGKGGEPGVDYTATTLPFNKDEYKALTQGVADLESHGRYDITGGAGGKYTGRYQMGPTEIRESAKELGLSEPSRDEFRKNPALQEKLYERYTLDHYNTMMKDPMFAAASHEKQLKALGAAQLGTTAGLKWLHGGSASDAWGTPTSSWANAVGKRLGQMGGGGATGGDIGPSNITKFSGFGSELGKFKGLRADNPEDRKKINAYMKEAGIGDPYNAESIAWCAAWLNSQLAHEGVKGSGGLGVDSFREWGKAEKASQAQAGDVMIAKGGSHVGRFEGMDPKTGLAKFYAGNEAAPGEGPNPNGIPGYPRRQWGRVNEREVDPGDFDFRGLDKDAIGKASEAKAAVAKADAPASKMADRMPPHPSSSGKGSAPTPHLGDMSQFQGDPYIKVHVSNPAGANIVTQVASLGVASGNFQT